MESNLCTIAFLDDFALLNRTQLTRRYFEPRIIEESQFFDPNYSLSYSSMQWCPEVEKYRLWYNVNHQVCKVEIGGETQDEHFMLAMAESADAIHWERGNYLNRPDGANLVWSGEEGSVSGAMVYRDPHDADPERRYKCAASLDSMRHGSQSIAPGIIATSPDGIHWNSQQLRYQWGRSMSDAYNCLFYNPVLGAYQVLFRAVLTDRRICTSYSSDLIHWSTPRVILAPDGNDPPCSEFYNMSAHYHDGIFYGFLCVFETDMVDRVPWKFKGNVYTELVYSYDGLSWQRTHQKAIGLRGIGEYGATQNYLFNMTPNRKGDQWMISGIFPLLEHGSATYSEHRTSLSNDSNRLVAHYTSTIQPGRLCGLQGVGDAFLRTKQFLLKDDQLTINAQCPHGEMKVQLIDIWQKPIAGFSFDDSERFSGDEIAWTPRWKERSISELLGKRIGIEIRLYTGCVYGITGHFHPFHGALPQQSYGDPRDIAEAVFGPTVDYSRIDPQ
ncbi:MAG: hypothetical protein IT447_11565 [Phycisphaerales bacterium]|nr:hypothetical protein [Phycisphaerales bacterium]